MPCTFQQKLKKVSRLASPMLNMFKTRWLAVSSTLIIFAVRNIGRICSVYIFRSCLWSTAPKRKVALAFLQPNSARFSESSVSLEEASDCGVERKQKNPVGVHRIYLKKSGEERISAKVFHEATKFLCSQPCVQFWRHFPMQTRIEIESGNIERWESWN